MGAAGTKNRAGRAASLAPASAPHISDARKPEQLDPKDVQLVKGNEATPKDAKKDHKVVDVLVSSSDSKGNKERRTKDKSGHRHHHKHRSDKRRSTKSPPKSSGSGRASRSVSKRASSGALSATSAGVEPIVVTDERAAALALASSLVLEVIGEEDNCGGFEGGEQQEGGSEVDENFIGDALALDGHDDDDSRDGVVQYLSSEREILVEQERAVREIAEVLSLPTASATQLLRHFRWNKDRLLHAYVEDAARVCRDAGISLPAVPSAHAAAAAAPRASLPVAAGGMCLICADSVSAENSLALSLCGHMFCHGCWAGYLALKISEGVTGITCPAVKCAASVDQATVQRLVPAADYARYLRFMSKTFVETNPNVRWCPAPGCGHAINVLDSARDSVACRCGFRFCFACNQEAHVPATCEQVKLWAKKGQDDSETTHWLLANTMECPKCKCTIEKNGGCNHMTCRQCRYEFCWLCRQNWKGHNDYYSCNRFQKAAAAAGAPDDGRRKKNKETAREREAREKEESRVALEKYLHYYKRYTDHDRSRRFETQVREEATRKMREMQETDATWVGVQFIARAAEQLIACRSVLKWSYVYAYYLADGSPAKNLFEYLQKDLEQTTEELSAALSAPVEALQRVPVMNLTKVAERMAAALSAAAEQAAAPPTPTPAPARAGSSRK